MRLVIRSVWLFLKKTGKMYIVDTDNNRIMILRMILNRKKILSEFMYQNEMLQSNKPEGIYVYENGNILIADTQNNRILKCDSDGKVLQIIDKPRICRV